MQDLNTVDQDEKSKRIKGLISVIVPNVERNCRLNGFDQLLRHRKIVDGIRIGLAVFGKSCGQISKVLIQLSTSFLGDRVKDDR